MNTPSLSQFKVWAKDNQSLAMAVCKATAFAKVTRERVDKYTVPIFESYGFKDEEGEPIPDKDQLYICKDEKRVATYYEKCNRANRVHGWNGPEDHCPALVASYTQTKMEWALLDKGCELLGLKDHPHHLDDRQKMLDLLLGACLKRA